ncbi:MAG: tight adherence protein B [Saprospiraceae bacterium]|jgi:tight adherence protein B
MNNTFFYVSVGLVFLAVFIIAWTVLTRVQGAFDNYRSSFTEAADANMTDMFLVMDVGRLFFINMLLLGLLPPLLWLASGNVMAGVLAFLVMLIIPAFIYRSMRGRRTALINKQLPDCLTMISSSLRAGASLPLAIEGLVKEQAPPISNEFDLFLREQRVGTEFTTALNNMEKRIGTSEFQMVASAMKISKEVGGNLGEVLEILADTLRQKATMEGKINSLTAQGRLQAIVMAALPVFLCAVLYFLEKESMMLLFTTPIGWAVLTFVVVWESIGFLFVRKIVSVDV